MITLMVAVRASAGVAYTPLSVGLDLFSLDFLLTVFVSIMSQHDVFSRISQFTYWTSCIIHLLCGTGSLLFRLLLTVFASIMSQHDVFSRTSQFTYGTSFIIHLLCGTTSLLFRLLLTMFGF